MESGIHELRRMNIDTNHRIDGIANDISNIGGKIDASRTASADIKDLVEVLTKTLTIHMTEDIARQERIAKEQIEETKHVAEAQNRRTDQIGRLTRAVMIAAAALAVTTVTMLGLRAILLEEEISLLNVLPFLGAGH